MMKPNFFGFELFAGGEKLRSIVSHVRMLFACPRKLSNPRSAEIYLIYLLLAGN